MAKTKVKKIFFSQRVGLFVDVSNMYHSAKNLYQANVNFYKILETAAKNRQLVKAIAYVIRSGSHEELSFFKRLKDQGFELKEKPLQVFMGGVKKADWDVGLAIDAIKISSKLDVVVLVTGDGDFIPLVIYLKEHQGCKVEIMAFKETTSNQLIEAADSFIDLSKNKRKFLLPAKIY